MRICHVVSAHAPQDVRVFHKLARPTAAAGHQVTIIAPGSGPLTKDGVRFLYVPIFRSRVLRQQQRRSNPHNRPATALTGSLGS